MLLCLQAVRTFFSTNRQTCEQWLNRLRLAAMKVSLNAGLYPSAIYHGQKILQDMKVNNNTQVGFQRMTVSWIKSAEWCCDSFLACYVFWKSTSTCLFWTDDKENISNIFSTGCWIWFCNIYDCGSSDRHAIAQLNFWIVQMVPRHLQISAIWHRGNFNEANLVLDESCQKSSKFKVGKVNFIRYRNLSCSKAAFILSIQFYPATNPISGKLTFRSVLWKAISLPCLTWLASSAIIPKHCGTEWIG